MLFRSAWTRARQKAAEKVRDVAAELLDIYAQRAAKAGFAFKHDREQYQLFCDGFPFETTPDQAQAINAVLSDMCQPLAMDRLVCGDVGFGKTEVAMRAALLAILKVRPTPFCVMDEIEAALDDANVVRFARYMRQMADKTQFIVITHRRGTMEEADVLYGVTMQEQGVSRILTINLNDVEKELHIK